MNRKALVIAGALLVVAVVVVVAVAAGGGGKKKTASPSNAPVAVASKSPSPKVSPGTSLVTLSKGSFNPKSMNVKVGQIVTFMNNSNDTIELDSDPHPSHTSFTAFNNHRVTAGKEFTFTFTKAMTLHYHNHLNPSVTGTITVQ